MHTIYDPIQKIAAVPALAYDWLHSTCQCLFCQTIMHLYHMSVQRGMRVCSVAVVTAMALIMGGVNVAVADIYINVSQGNSKFLSSYQTTGDADYEDTGVLVLLGKHFRTNAAIELGYADLGETHIDLKSGDSFEGAEYEEDSEISVSATTYSLGVAGLHDVNESVVFVLRGGIHNIDRSITTYQNGKIISKAKTEKDTGLYLGLGAEYELTSNIHAGLYYTVYFSGEFKCPDDTICYDDDHYHHDHHHHHAQHDKDEEHKTNRRRYGTKQRDDKDISIVTFGIRYTFNSF